MATEKQVAYIKELLHQKRTQYWRKADAIRATTDLTSHDNRHAAADVQKYDLLVLAYETIQVPDDLSEKQASAWIDALKGVGDTLIETALDRPQTAERIGLTALIAAQGVALEKALR